MNFSYFIAKRIGFGEHDSFSRFIIRMAIVSIALSVAIMIGSVCMVSGFTKEIKQKIFGFWGEIHIHNLDNQNSFESDPITITSINQAKVKQLKEVKLISPYITKAGILKTKTEIEGIVVKGIDTSYDWKFISNYLTEGQSITYTQDSTFSKEVLISKIIANKLHLDIGDKVLLYFLKKGTPQPIGRKVVVAGIYKTGLYEYDEKFILCDIKLLQQINSWNQYQASGLEVRLTNMDAMDRIKDEIYYKIIDNTKYAETIKEIYPTIFDWLNLLRSDELIILLILSIVAVLNIISSLIILILDRTQMIGILKTLGATTQQVKQIFIFQAAYIIFFGLIIGNTVAVFFCWLQQQFKFIKLNEENYYLSEVPVEFNLPLILLINIVTFIICYLILYIPSVIIAKITPIKAIRFD